MIDGFTESFEAFYAREHRVVVGVAHVLSGSLPAAEDLAQDAFVAALRRWEEISSYDDPTAWVCRVVSNMAVSRFRRLAAETRALVRFGSADRALLDMSADAIAVWQAVRRLPRRQAQAIALRFYAGMSIAEVARVLGCSENTVKTHLLRGKATLAGAFDEEGTYGQD